MAQLPHERPPLRVRSLNAPSQLMYEALGARLGQTTTTAHACRVFCQQHARHRHRHRWVAHRGIRVNTPYRVRRRMIPRLSADAMDSNARHPLPASPPRPANMTRMTRIQLRTSWSLASLTAIATARFRHPPPACRRYCVSRLHRRFPWLRRLLQLQGQAGPASADVTMDRKCLCPSVTAVTAVTSVASVASVIRAKVTASTALSAAAAVAGTAGRVTVASHLLSAADAFVRPRVTANMHHAIVTGLCAAAPHGVLIARRVPGRPHHAARHLTATVDGVTSIGVPARAGDIAVVAGVASMAARVVRTVRKSMQGGARMGEHGVVARGVPRVGIVVTTDGVNVEDNT